MTKEDKENIIIKTDECLKEYMKNYQPASIEEKWTMYSHIISDVKRKLLKMNKFQLSLTFKIILLKI